ncbi:MAG: ketopantoate reductase family protein [Pararhodobacter sp.]|nr:ketopantoate reductase family protein [Pararhodobacter sp.]
MHTKDIEIRSILVFGAGVLGSLYAAWLHRAGYDVTLLARGQRYQDLMQHGVVLEDFFTGARSTTQLRVVNEIPADERFDLCLVLVQKTQLDGALERLTGKPGIKAFVFMNNTAEGPEAMVQALGRDRVLMGHANAGGERRGHEVLYIVAERMTLGELDGRASPRVKAIAAAMRKAGFAADISRNVDAWKRYHVALAVPFALAMHRNRSDRLQLRKNRADLRLCLRGMRECFAALKALGYPMEPARLRLVFWLPDMLLAWLFRLMLRTKTADIGMERHLRNAEDEMQALTGEMLSLIEQAGIDTPAMDRLRRG